MKRMLSEIKEALEKVTPGKWEARKEFANRWRIESHAEEGKVPLSVGLITTTVLEVGMPNANTEANAHLIANAPEWLRYLIGEVERLEDVTKEGWDMANDLSHQVEELRKALEDIESIKYNVLGYSPEDAQCMNDIARQALERLKG